MPIQPALFGLIGSVPSDDSRIIDQSSLQELQGVGESRDEERRTRPRIGIHA